jgi:imidazolonepropionase-like amidohydrolase
VPIAHAIVSQDSIEHLSGYPLGATDGELAAMSRNSGVWNCPTMTVFTRYVTRDMPEPGRTQFLNARRALVTALHEAGARILAGTDCGYYFPCGTPLLDELDELHAAGMSNFEALSAATRSAGEYLDDLTLGVIAPGSSADFLLVRGNPLDDLSALRRPAGVMLRGRWIPLERRRAVRK